MLIGAHVSPAGGLQNAVERGLERGCRAIQMFNQSPRMWRPTQYGDEDFAAFREAMEPSDIEAVLIHTVYLINTATEDREMREKSLASLVHSLRVGEGIRAQGVVLHAGSAKAGDVPAALERAGKLIREALKQTDKCPLHLENTAGAGGTLGRSFEELARLIELSGGGKRLGVCLDSCHLLASGYDIRTPDGLAQVIDEFDSVVGCDRLGSLHVNDSQAPLGSNRDRHAPLGTGELGRKGCAAFLSEPRFEGLPCVFEGPGVSGKAPERADIDTAWELRDQGLRARKRARSPRAVKRRG